MSADTRQQKVLRIGIIQDGKIIQERFVKAGEAVTVGGSPKASFVFADTKIGAGEFALFVWRDNQYHLQFSEDMKGKVSSNGAPISLEKAWKDPSTPSANGTWSVPLTEADRGKITIAPVTILFQFVTPPPVQGPVAGEVYDFRPRFMDDEDPVFLGILAIWFALGVVFSVYVMNAEPPEISLEEIPDRFTSIVLDSPPPPPVEDDNAEDKIESDEGKPQQKAEKPEEAPPKEVKKTGDEAVDKARQQEAAKDRVAQQSALFQQLQIVGIGTTGANASGTILDGNTLGDGSNIGDKLREAVAAGASLGDGSSIRGGAGVPGGTGDKNVGDLKAGADLVAGGPGSAPKVEVKGRTSVGDLDFGGGDTAGVAAVVRQYRGQLQYCYEQALKENPSLSGKVTVGWTVASEAATDIYIVSNATGDEGFATCIKRKIQRWAFKGVDDGDATQTFQFEKDE